MFNLDDCFALITSRSGKVFSTALDAKFKRYNVSRSQWIAMYYIYNNRAITQRQLADKIASKEPTVVRLLQKLEYEGWLQRSSGEKDKRIKELQLTDKGREVFEELVPIVETFKNDTIQGISEENLNIFKDTLNKMIENTKKNK